MELLNNLWMAISTPNETLINTITIPIFFVENFLIMTLFLTILNIKATGKQKLIYVLSMSIFSIFSMLLIPNPFNIFLNYLVMIILSYCVFKMNLLKSILAIVISIVVFALIGTLTLNPYLTILNIT